MSRTVDAGGTARVGSVADCATENLLSATMQDAGVGLVTRRGFGAGEIGEGGGEALAEFGGGGGKLALLFDFFGGWLFCRCCCFGRLGSLFCWFRRWN